MENVEVKPDNRALKPGDNVSELVNDAGYLVPGEVSDLNNDADISQRRHPSGADRARTRQGVPTNLSPLQVGGNQTPTRVKRNVVPFKGDDVRHDPSGNGFILSTRKVKFGQL